MYNYKAFYTRKKLAKKKRNRIKEMNSLKHNMEDTPADTIFMGRVFIFQVIKAS